MTLRPDTPPKWGPVTAPVNNQAFPIGDVGPFVSGGQQSALSLNLTAAGYVQPVNPKDPNSDNECYIVIDLAGSTVSPGTLDKDDSENRGYYTHGIEIRMSLAGEAAIPPLLDWKVDASTPPTSPATGSGSVSTGSSVSGGFFGTQLTATGGWSSSESGGRTYQDYEVKNNTTHKTVQGTGSEEAVYDLALRLCDTGPYRTPFSLIKADDSYLAGLPPRATADLPLTSAASFMAILPVKHYPQVDDLTVTIKHWLAKVVWYSTEIPASHVGVMNPFDQNQQVQMVTKDHWARGGSMPYTELVDEYDMTKSPGVYLSTMTGLYCALPWLSQYTGRYMVDWTDGRIS
jgi:hypothetical protein